MITQRLFCRMRLLMLLPITMLFGQAEAICATDAHLLTGSGMLIATLQDPAGTNTMPAKRYDLAYTVVGVIYATLIFILILQQFMILKRDSDDRDAWPRIARRYIRHFRYTAILGMLFFAASLTAILMRMNYSSEIINRFLDDPEILYFFVIIFVVSVLRLIIDRAVDEPIGALGALSETLNSIFRPNKTKAATQELAAGQAGINQKSDPFLWFLVFVFSLIIAILLRFVDVSAEAGLSKKLGVLASIVAAMAFVLAWYCWIYVGLFDKMVRQHEFSGYAARRFLGGALVQQDIPLQAVVIGPKKAGKSAFVRNKTIRNKLLNTDRIIAVPLRLESSRKAVKRKQEFEYKQPFIATLIDTPGENMGDHLLMVSHYRCDTLVLVLQAEQFILTELLKHDQIGFADLSNCMVENNDWVNNSPALKEIEETAGVGGDTTRGNPKFYVQALYSAVQRTDPPMRIDENNKRKDYDPYKVRSFILYINRQESSSKEVVKWFYQNGRLKDLASEIGKKFSVSSDDCLGISGLALSSANELVMLSSEERRERLREEMIAFGIRQTEAMQSLENDADDDVKPQIVPDSID